MKIPKKRSLVCSMFVSPRVQLFEIKMFCDSFVHSVVRYLTKIVEIVVSEIDSVICVK